MSPAQVKIIAGTIVKRAFEKIGDIDNFVSEYIADNIEVMVASALGIECRSNGEYTRLQTSNSFVAALTGYIASCARKVADTRGPLVLDDMLKKKAEAKVTKELKRAVTSVYDDAYARRMRELVESHLTINYEHLEEQTKEIVAEARRMSEGASKAMIESYIRAAEGANNDRR